jgi:hypothetical protein
MLSLNTGGVMRKSKNICIGKRGGNSVYRKIVEVWVLEIYIVLI